MGWATKLQGQRGAAMDFASGSAYSKTLTSGGSTHSKGAYVALSASVPADVWWHLFRFYAPTGGTQFLVDVATGAAGAEKILIPDVLFLPPRDNFGEAVLLVPCHLKAGQRLAARCSCSATSKTMGVAWHAIGGGFATLKGMARAETLGANSGTTRGTQIDPGGSANTKGSYITIGTTGFDWKWLVVILGTVSGAMPTGQTEWRADVALGGTPDIIVPDWTIATDSNSDDLWSDTITIPFEVPAGTAVKIRAQCSITDATDRLLDAVVVGIG